MSRRDLMRRAFVAANIERHGWSFDRAMTDPTMRRTLEHTADAIERRVVTHRVARYGDTLQCLCGRQWSVDDENPPEECRK